MGCGKAFWHNSAGPIFAGQTSPPGPLSEAERG